MSTTNTISCIATGNNAEIIQCYIDNTKYNKYNNCMGLRISSCQSQLDGKVVFIGKVKTEYSVIVLTSTNLAIWYSGFTSLTETVILGADIYAGDTIGNSLSNRIKIALLNHTSSKWPIYIQGYKENWYMHDPTPVLSDSYNEDINEGVEDESLFNNYDDLDIEEVDEADNLEETDEDETSVINEFTGNKG